MKPRVMMALVVTVVSFLVLIFTLAVAAQESPVELKSQNKNPDIVSGSTFDTNFTSVITGYLPVVFKDYTPCNTMPTLISPPNGVNQDTLIPLFSWNNGSDPNATESVLQVAEDYEFKHGSWSTYSYYQSGVDEIRFPWNLKPATTYYWRVWLKCRNTNGPYSEVWSFATTTNGIILPAPNLIAPASGTIVPSTRVTLQWSAVDGAVEYAVHWIKIGQAWTNFMRVSGTQANLQLAYNSTYEWWIRAINDYALGGNSETWHFDTPIGPAYPPLLNWNQSFIITMDESGMTFKEQDSR